jgi:hypothetical protein
MGENVHVDSIEALGEFVVRYRSFVLNLLEILELVRFSYYRQYEEIREAVRRQQQHVQELEDRCRNSREEDKDDACIELREAEEELERMRKISFTVENYWVLYSEVENKVKGLARDLGARAEAKLKEIFEILRVYTVISPPGDKAVSGVGEAGEKLSGQVVSGLSGGVNSIEGEKGKDVVDLSNYVLPEGFRWVSLEEIDMGEILREEFQKVDYETMKRGLEKLPEVLERMQERLKCKACGGEGRVKIRSGLNSIERFEFRLESRLSPDRKQLCRSCGGTGIVRGGHYDYSSYFWRIDRQAGRSYEEGLQRVYDAFFGADHIRLYRFKWSLRLKVDDKSRHWIQVARDLGWKFIPAKVIEIEK